MGMGGVGMVMGLPHRRCACMRCACVRVGACLLRRVVWRRIRVLKGYMRGQEGTGDAACGLAGVGSRAEGGVSCLIGATPVPSRTRIRRQS
jgi:hypothetical protein